MSHILHPMNPLEHPNFMKQGLRGASYRDTRSLKVARVEREYLVGEKKLTETGLGTVERRGAVSRRR